METAVDQPIINEDEIRRALCDGSNFEKGKMRIQYYFSQPVLPPREEMVRWLKKNMGQAAGRGTLPTAPADGLITAAAALKSSVIPIMGR